MTMLKKITALAVLLGAVSLGSLLFAQLQVYGPYSCSSGQGTTNTLPVKLPGPFMIQGAVSITYSGYLVIIDNNTTYAFSESTWPLATQIFSANATITLSASPGGYEEQDSSNVTVSFLVDVTPQSSFMPIITESPTVYTKGSVVVTASGSVETGPALVRRPAPGGRSEGGREGPGGEPDRRVDQFQNYFRLYSKLSGMTGTADTEAFEFQQTTASRSW